MPYAHYISGLRVKQGGKLVKKEDLRRDMVYALAGAINPAQVGINPSPQCMLTIEDPVTPGNDVARASYSVGTIKEEFRLAYNYLQKGVIEERDPTHRYSWCYQIYSNRPAHQPQMYRR